MKRHIQAIALVLILFFSGATVWAQEDGEKPVPEKKKIKTMIDYKDELGLSEDQVKEVATALVSFQETVRKLRADLAQHQQDYKKLLADDTTRFVGIRGLMKQKLDILHLDSPTDYRLIRLKSIKTYHAPLGPAASRHRR